MIDSIEGILRTLLALLVVMGVGGFLRKRGLVGHGSTESMRRIVADVGFPALCLHGLSGMSRDELGRGTPVVAAGFFVLAIAAIVGAGVARVSVTAPKRGAFAFAAAIGNWIFLPLPIAKALYGDEGERTVLLFNTGAQVFLWTFGVGLLDGRPGSSPADGPAAASMTGRARRVVRNPGLWATAIGIASATAGFGTAKVPVLGDVLVMLGSLTIPLAALAIGASLAESSPSSEPSRSPALSILVVTRLVIVPVVTTVLLATLLRMVPGCFTKCGTVVLVIVSAMPVSLTAGTLVPEADSPFVARAILASTLFSVVTVPLFFAVATHLP
ncbi:MAG: AEC family transporter [Polyangiaceae bacterium]